MTGIRLGTLVPVLAALAVIPGGCCNQKSTFIHSRDAYYKQLTGAVRTQQDAVVVFIPDQTDSLRMKVTGRTSVATEQNDVSDYPDFEVFHEPVDTDRFSTVTFESAPAVEFVSGWMYFKGKAPIGKTRRVRAVGKGTEFAIFIESDKDYVYMLNGTHIEVTALATNTRCRDLTPNKYLTVDNNGTCDGPYSFDMNDQSDPRIAKIKRLQEQPPLPDS